MNGWMDGKRESSCFFFLMDKDGYVDALAMMIFYSFSFTFTMMILITPCERANDVSKEMKNSRDG